MQATFSGRLGTSWKEAWFPNFDEVWPEAQSLRRAFEEAAANAWDCTGENDVLETITDRRDELSPAQQTMVDELEVINHSRRGYVYHNELREQLERIESREIRHPKSRVAAFDAGVSGLLRSEHGSARSRAREYLAKAQNIRERLLVEDDVPAAD